ncbi:hypothetical protein FDA94_29080 [Herbidospora galbida]|uniref:Uncharacterized protein n=1 Tax=Herbidospora galbida TaxID=2575442 RepID=A0A4U3M8T1_9ACTN|nr:hypothetical protein [Herbidospora galbida]TKK84669.1 hypothetical protein FDA94_29080 [Herbidospora galbida]
MHNEIEEQDPQIIYTAYASRMIYDMAHTFGVPERIPAIYSALGMTPPSEEGRDLAEEQSRFRRLYIKKTEEHLMALSQIAAQICAAVILNSPANEAASIPPEVAAQMTEQTAAAIFAGAAAIHAQNTYDYLDSEGLTPW